MRGTEIEECCDETPLDGVLEFELGSEGGIGLREGFEFRDIVDGDREEGKTTTLPLEVEVSVFAIFVLW